MTQMEILSLAQDALLRRYELARSMVRAKPCDQTKAYRDKIVKDCVEVNHMIQNEHRKRLEQAEQERMKATPQKPQEKQKQHPAQYHVVLEFVNGKKAKEEFPNKETGTAAYNKMKDLMGTPVGIIISRVSLTENDVTIRSYERGEF